MTIHDLRPIRLGLALAVLLGLALGAPARALVCTDTGGVLQPGVPVANVSSGPGCPGPVFTVEIPAGATRLTFSTSGGAGNADLFVKRGSEPLPPTSFDASSEGPGNLESVVIDNPQGGTWYVRVVPREPFSGVTLTADFEAPQTPIAAGVPAPGLADPVAGELRYFTIEVPPGTAHLTITTSGGTGDVDLLVRRGGLPTSTVFDAASRGGRTNGERVDIASPQGGLYRIALLATAPYSGVTLTATLTPGGTCVPAADTACLLGNRFEVKVSWTNQHAGNATGTGKALPGTDQTAYFWFFNPENTELVVKMVDGRELNGRFWVFRGGLSDVDYVIHVTDTVTGAQRSYHNPADKLTSEADTSAF